MKLLGIGDYYDGGLVLEITKKGIKVSGNGNLIPLSNVSVDKCRKSTRTYGTRAKNRRNKKKSG